ncbi:tRNA lysidine(34) synthetase TilS [Zhengella sp. ZM62]|uniref:tRNA lysidine(34) synthetase TilS n=1 Tax=Zhengella sedimenti TaxID=3390035 RepID=UPI0039752A16
MPAADAPDRCAGPHDILHSIDFRLPDGHGPVALAVSGGGDSMALLTLAAKAAAGDRCRIVVLTVDHGLRPDARGEAEAVAGHCAALGIAHRVLRWTGDKPVRGLMAAARQARYNLLAEAAEQDGCGMVLTGHTLDDQVETLAMRAARGNGPGLAGIAPATLHEGRTWFARPLLGLRRADLRGLLREQGVAWAEDPSNGDDRFERPRWRSMLAGETQDRVTRLLARAGTEAQLRHSRAAAAAAVIADIRAFDPGGWPRGLAFLAGGNAAPEIVAEAALQASRLLGRQAYGPGPGARAAVAALLAGPGGKAFTAGGAVFRRMAGRLAVCPDPRGPERRPGLPPLIPGFDYPAFAALARRLELDIAPEPGFAVAGLRTV